MLCGDGLRSRPRPRLRLFGDLADVGKEGGKAAGITCLPFFFFIERVIVRRVDMTARKEEEAGLDGAFLDCKKERGGRKKTGGNGKNPPAKVKDDLVKKPPEMPCDHQACLTLASRRTSVSLFFVFAPHSSLR
jgi:hypothetical protein